MDAMGISVVLLFIILVLILIGFVLGMLEIFIFEPRRQLRKQLGGEDDPW